MEISEVSDLPVYICKGQFLVWDAEVVTNLRRNHRIIGNCVGSLPWKPRQVIQGSLPLRLSKIEVAFLTKRKLVVLKDGNQLDQNHFTSHLKNQINEARLRQRDAQSTILQEQKAKELEMLASTIIEGMQKKQNGKSDTTSATNPNNSVDHIKFDEFKRSEIDKSSFRLNDQLWLEMPISMTLLKDLPNIPAYNLNLSEKETLLYDVFCDLYDQDQGFYITNACKFGGDFLVYPGDPVAYHSFHIAVCIPHKDKLSGLEYSRYGRLANTVRKTLLICSKNDAGHIDYLSVSWTGIAQYDEKKS